MKAPLASVAVLGSLLLRSLLGATPATLEIDSQERLGPMAIERIGLGQGGLSDSPMWSDRAAEISALHPHLIRLFIQEYFDLLPEKGRYQFETLDRSVELIRQTGASPLMCIAFKPHLLFPKLDQDIVEPADESGWEALVTALVAHYRERNAGIRYWEIMNEPDIGEDGGCPYRFRPESYVRCYERTAAAVRRGDPEARVGGPALANCRSPLLPALLEACEAKRLPLDFVSWHVYSSDPKQIRGTIDHVKALLRAHPTLHPETILDEWNMNLGTPPTDPSVQPCFIAETAWQMKEAGLDEACYYHIRDYPVRPEQFAPFMSPHGTAFMARWWNRMPQFDGLFDFQNNVRPAYFLFKLLTRLTGEQLRLKGDSASVHGFATWDATNGLFNLLVWNYSDDPVQVRVLWKGSGPNLAVTPLRLDALTPSNEENARLHPDPGFELIPGREVTTEFAPHQVRFWQLEPHRRAPATE